MIISAAPLLQKIAYVYALEWYHFIFICLSVFAKAADESAPSLQTYGSER